MFSGFSLSLTNCPAFENSLSDGTEDPGTPKYLEATLCNRGYLLALFFHHSNGLLDLLVLGSSKYRLTSMIQSVPVLLWEVDSATLRSNVFHRL